MRKRQRRRNREVDRALGEGHHLGLVLAALLMAGLVAWAPARSQGAEPMPGLQEEQPSAAGGSGSVSAGHLVLSLQDGELPEAPPDAALVYFVNSWKGGVVILLDEQPLAVLPDRSFLAVQIDPGVRLVWGWHSGRSATDAEWFEFRPGRTYVLDHPAAKVWAKARSMQSLGWLLESDELLSTVWQLSYTTPTEEELVSLQGAFEKHQAVEPDAHRRRPGQRWVPPPKVFKSAYDDAMRVAGRPSSARLPVRFKASFSDTMKRPKLLSLKTTNFVRGTLTVADEGVRFESKKMSLEVPVSQIRDLCFGGFTQNPQEDSVPVIRLDYEPSEGGETRTAYFKPAESEHHAVSCLYNPVFAAVSEALESSPPG